MFLPNSYSFLLVRPAIFKPVIKLDIPESPESITSIFLPNSLSFLLVRPTIFKPVIKFETEESATSPPPSSPPPDSGSGTIGDKNKRTFLKAAGIAGAGLAASLLIPKKADALIMGSSPTTGVVGVKNAANTRINPATQETVSTLLKTTDLTFDAGNLSVKIASVSGAGSSSYSDSGVRPEVVW